MLRYMYLLWERPAAREQETRSMSEKNVRVLLYRNPWKEIIDNDTLLGIIRECADNIEEKLCQMIEDGEVDPSRNSFGCVILDPTETSDGSEAVELVLATIAVGPNGEQYIPNGLAKAHATVRHGYTWNGLLVAKAPHCLDSSDFAWGDAAILTIESDEGMLFPVGCAAGSGLSSEQDHDVALVCLTNVMAAVDKLILDWVAKKRSGGVSHGWYNIDNRVGDRYQKVLSHPHVEFF